MKSLILFLTVIVALSVSAQPASADTFGSGANAFDIDFVTIGNAGNAPDTTGDPNPGGAVSYTYRIGKYEISQGMIDAANAEGGLGISIDRRAANYPATNVDWFESARFVNWLNTSTGNTPAYKFNGSSFALWEPDDAGYDPENLYRNSQARYVLPSTDEWYKAAYYDPASEVYYDYPTGSDTQPAGIQSGTAPGTAVWRVAFGVVWPAEITQAGGLSPYGTMAQGGNVHERGESASNGLNDDPSVPRIWRGGSWNFSAGHMKSTSLVRPTGPNHVSNQLGFRVASLDPVSTLLADLTGNGFVDFEDLTVLLANWNQEVGADAGNLVHADTTPVNFEDLTVLLAEWTGPKPGGSPEAALGTEPVPEPSAMVLAVIGLLGVCCWRRKRRTRTNS